MVLESTQPATEISTRSISCMVKAASAKDWPPSCADCLEIWRLIILDSSGPVQVSTGIALPLPWRNTVGQTYNSENDLTFKRTDLRETEGEFSVSYGIILRDGIAQLVWTGPGFRILEVARNFSFLQNFQTGCGRGRGQVYLFYGIIYTKSLNWSTMPT